MSYTQYIETHMVRRVHEVTFHDGSRVIDIQADLAHVPQQAVLIEVEEPDYESAIQTQKWLLRFQEEETEKEEA